MRERRQPPPDSTQPTRGLREDSLSLPVPDTNIEEPTFESRDAVERQSAGGDEDLELREGATAEEAMEGTGNRSEEAI